MRSSSPERTQPDRATDDGESTSIELTGRVRLLLPGGIQNALN
jgi:hypothetical protein